MGNNLSNYRRPASIAGDDHTSMKYKSSIRTAGGVEFGTRPGVSGNYTDSNDINPGFTSLSGSSCGPPSINITGNGSSCHGLDPPTFVRNRRDLVSMRSSKYSPKPATPMPNADELEKRFTKVLVRKVLSYFAYPSCNLYM